MGNEGGKEVEGVKRDVSGRLCDRKIRRSRGRKRRGDGNW